MAQLTYRQYTINIGEREVKVEWDERMDINILFYAVFNHKKDKFYFYRQNIDDGDGEDDNHYDNCADTDADDIGCINDELGFFIYGRNTRRTKLLGSTLFTLRHNWNRYSCRLTMENLLSTSERPDIIYVNVHENNEAIQVHQRIEVKNGESQKPQNQLVFELNDEPNEDLYVQHVIKSYEKRGKRIHKQYMELIKASEREIPLGLLNITRCKFTCIFYKVKKVSDVKYFVTDSYHKEFNSHNSIHDVNCLYEKAKGFIKGEGNIPVRYLYRNKPSAHLTIQDMDKTGVMKKYIKDNSGDPCSSINNRIDGLFFCASPNRFTGDPPEGSPFGDYRIMIKPQYLLPGLNLYFADLYCMYDPHYVTLVLTKPGSTEDIYCHNRLIPLDIKENEFFWYSYEDNQYYTTDQRGLWVELFYTEDIEVDRMKSNNELSIVTKCPIFYNGQSKSNGISKKRYCEICNLPKIPI